VRTVRICLSLTVLLVLCLGAGCGGGGGQQQPAAKIAPPRITTTLDGHQAVPLRFRWLAHPSVPEDQVSQVDFLIDGRLLGVEHEAPYNYGSDDLHGHLGWLVTSWLRPGPHRFTARARLNDGRTASDTVIARVDRAPTPPASLAGARWRRKVTKRAIAQTGGDIPAGAWQLIVDRAGVWELDPHGSGVVEHLHFRRHRVVVDAALWMTSYVDGHGQLNRYGHTDIGAGFREDGPPAIYRWSATAKTLTLTAIKDPTDSRRALWEGVWARAG
jgi:hypothetical protein